MKFSGNLLDGITYYSSSGIGNENQTFQSDLGKAKNQIVSLMTRFQVKEEVS
jgi:hypothetical protein